MAGCGFNCAKYTLFFFNALFWLIGAGILALGIWLRVDPSSLEFLQLGDFENGDQELIYAAYFLIAAGAAIFIIGFTGCCGAIRESQCLLGFYIVCMLGIIGLEIAAGVYAYIKRDELIGKLENALTDMLTDKFDGENAVSKTWNKAMIEFECCGVKGIDDFADSNWKKYNATGNDVVPAACCVQTKNGDFNKPEPSNPSECQREASLKEGSNVYVTGCSESVEKWLTDKAMILIGVGLGVAAFEYIICMLFIIGLEIAAGVYAYLKRDELLKRVEGALSKVLTESYDGENAASLTWNKAMIEFKCCGVKGPTDFANSKWKNGSTSLDVVPAACCIQTGDSDYKEPVAENNVACQAGTEPDLNTKGCTESVKDWLTQRAMILIGVGLGVAAFEIIILILALCVCCQIRRKE